MTESNLVTLRALRAAIAGGQVAPSQWDVVLLPAWGDTGQRLNEMLHPPPYHACQCDDREWVLAGLDRLIEEMEDAGGAACGLRMHRLDRPLGAWSGTSIR